MRRNYEIADFNTRMPLRCFMHQIGYVESHMHDYFEVDLILSGHYCNGPWRVPIWDQALYIPQLGWFPEASSYTGMSWLGSTPQHISPGLGDSPDYPWFMPFRLFNAPGATMLVLTASVH